MFHRHKHAPAAVPVCPTPVATVPAVLTPVSAVTVAPAIVPVAPAPPGPILAFPWVATIQTQTQQQQPAGGGLKEKSKVSEAVKSAAQTMASSSDTTAPTEATLRPVTMTQAAESFPAQTTMGGELPVNFIKEERPAIIKERILSVEEESIQPVIHREVERREIHEILQPIHERQVLAPTFEEKQLQAEFRPVVGSYAPRQAATIAPSVEYAATEKTQIVKPPIIEETIKKTVIEEVQPVIHREVVKPHIIKQTQDIYEKILEPEVILKETRPMLESSGQTFTGFQAQAAPLQTMQTKYAFEIDQKTKLKPLGTINEPSAYQYKSTYQGYPGAK